MVLKFTVVQIYLPEWVTGSVRDIKVFNDPESAIDYKNELEKNDDDSLFEVIVEQQAT